MTENKLYSSGYTDDLANEIDTAGAIPVERGFTDLRECYVSESGHTRLFASSPTSSTRRFTVRPSQRSSKSGCGSTIPTYAAR